MGLLVIVPGSNDTLRIDGRARIVRDVDFGGAWAPAPEPAVVVEIEELFLHCAKAFLRSALWDAATWPTDVPSAGRIAKSQSGTRVPAGVIDAALRLEARLRL